MNWKYTQNNNFYININNNVFYYNDVNGYVENKPIIENDSFYIDTTTQRFKIILTNKCNSNCNYCFTMESRNNESVDVDYVIKAFDTCVDITKPIQISFIGGGEPTLEFEKIKSIVDYTKKAMKNSVSYTIITNGLFNQTVRNYLKDNAFDITVSFDGYYSLHNSQQSTPITQYIYQRIINNTLSLQATNNVLVNCVIESKNINETVMKNICQAFQKLKISRANICIELDYLKNHLEDKQMNELLAMLKNYINCIANCDYEYNVSLVYKDPLFSREVFCTNYNIDSNYDVTVFPNNSLGLCYISEDSIITKAITSSLDIISNKNKLAFDMRKQIANVKIKCSTCLARQTCSISNCPVNISKLSSEELSNWCKNMIHIKEEILSYLIEKAGL